MNKWRPYIQAKSIPGGRRKPLGPPPMKGKVIMPNLIHFIADHYGKMSQLRMTQEEAAELIQAINKLIRHLQTGNKDEGKYLIALAEEVADVEIMLAQVNYLMGPGFKKLVENFEIEKTDRQFQRIFDEYIEQGKEYWGRSEQKEDGHSFNSTGSPSIKFKLHT